MAEERPTFVVETRTGSGKGVARKLRAAGRIPAICYGAGAEAVSVTADPDLLYKLLTTKRRTNIVFKLQIEGGKSFNHVMVRDYQIDPIRQILEHADFVVLDPEKRVSVTVPVSTPGRPRGVREGGRLQMIRAEVPVTCRPDDIPVEVEYDVTDLGLGESLLASQLNLPEGVEPNYKVDYAVAQISVPRGARGKGEEAAAPAGKKK